MKHKAFKFDYELWESETLKEVEKYLKKSLLEAIEQAIGSDDAFIYLPCLSGEDDGFGGPKVNDPLTVYMRVGLPGFDENPIYEFSIRDEVERDIKMCDGDYSYGLARFAEALRDMAHEIDTANGEKP